MAKEEITPESINARKIDEIERRHKEEIDALKTQMQLLQIIATKVSEAPPEQEATKKIIQINTDGKSYFCETPEEKHIFFENHPEAKKYKCQDCGEKFDSPAVEDGKILACTKCRSKRIYVNTETYSIDQMPVYIADKYLNDPKNKKQFTRKAKND
jgi:DNA-directed RNA polymerase subunit RPC12/RpoP